MNEDVNKDENISKIFFDTIYKKLKNYLNLDRTIQKNINIFNQNPTELSNIEFDDINNFSKLNKELYIDYHYKAMQMNLRKYDKFSMAHGVECRFPFLDWRLAAYTFSLDSKMKIKNGFSKKILRDCMKGNLDKKILKRVKKKGFNPANELFNNTMFQFINDTLRSSEFKELDFVDKNKVNNLLKIKNLNYKEVFKYIQIFFLIKTFSKGL